MIKHSKNEVEASIYERLRFNREAPDGYIERLICFEYIDCSLEELWADFRVIIPKEAMNRIKTAHGGYVAAIGDETTAITTEGFFHGNGTATTTLDMQIHTMKAMFPGDEIIVHCDYSHVGKRTILANARFMRGNELCAVFSQNFVLLPVDHLEIVRWK